MKTPPEVLESISRVINEDGFKAIEIIFLKKVSDSDNLDYVSGNAFEDGVLKGVVTGMKIYLRMIEDFRKELRELNKEGGKYD